MKTLRHIILILAWLAAGTCAWAQAPDARRAHVTINSLEGARIYLDGTLAGTSACSADLAPGTHTFEAKLASHRPIKYTIELLAGKSDTISLNPVPVYGRLAVTSEPEGAAIFINEKNYGQTPAVIENLLIGQYWVRLDKEGYAAEAAIATIEEGKTAKMDCRLRSGREVTITSDPEEAELFVDGKKAGTTPVTLTLA